MSNLPAKPLTAQSVAESIAKRMGGDAINITDLFAAALWKLGPQHSHILLGNPDTGWVVKMMCSSGGTVGLPARVTGELITPYPRCQFCGHVFDPSAIIDHELMLDTDLIDSWPAITSLVEEYDGAAR